MNRLAALLPAVSIAAGAAAAGELAGVSLPDQDSAADRALVLNGMGLREATVLKVDVYVAGLYLETRASDAETILRSDQAKRIRMHFVRNVGRADLAKAWEEGFANNLLLHPVSRHL